MIPVRLKALVFAVVTVAVGVAPGLVAGRFFPITGLWDAVLRAVAGILWGYLVGTAASRYVLRQMRKRQLNPSDHAK